jgi:methionine synthase I (cobalamin-dependent)
LHASLYIVFGMLDHYVSQIKDSLSLSQDPVLLNCKCGAELLLSQIQPFESNFNNLLSMYNKLLPIITNQKTDSTHIDETFNKNLVEFHNLLSAFANLNKEVVVFGKIIGQTAADLEKGES